MDKCAVITLSGLEEQTKKITFPVDSFEMRKHENPRNDESTVVVRQPQSKPWIIQNENEETKRSDSINSSVIDVQPERNEDDFSDTQSNVHIYPEDEENDERIQDRTYTTLIAFVLLLCVVPLLFGLWVLFVLLLLPIIPCLSAKGRRRFINCCKNIYELCPLCVDCVEKEVNNVHGALKRYAEDIREPEEIEEQLRTDSRMIPIIESIEKKYPDLFFHFIPTGSLVEKFGKSVTTSNSVLATDYDIMLIPSGISVGKNDFDTFRPIKAKTETGRDLNEFSWLSLNDEFLEQWEKFCLRRRIKDDDEDNTDDGEAVDNIVRSREENNVEGKMLSTYLLKDAIRKGIEESKDIKSNAANVRENVTIHVEDRGPALSVKISEWDTDLTCIRYREKYWEADFTLGLRCTDWPTEVINGFFKREGKWPPADVIDRIQRFGCHLVPKPSEDFRIKLHLNAESMYARCPGLEWRYSFSVAEYILSRHIPEQARIAFLGFKAMIKKHVNAPLKKHNVNLKICSFSLKCILYRLLESKEPEYWMDGGEVNILVERTYDELYERLIVEFKVESCPNFWLPGINLFKEFKNKDFHKNKIIAKLERLKGCEDEDKMSSLIDPGLEYERCLYMNCCFCLFSPSTYCCGSDHSSDNKDLEKMNLRPPPSNEMKFFHYDEDTCPCNGCLAWKDEFHVY